MKTTSRLTTLRALLMVIVAGMPALCQPASAEVSALPPLEKIVHAEVVDDRFAESSHTVKTANLTHLTTIRAWTKTHFPFDPEYTKNQRAELTVRLWMKGEEKPAEFLFVSEEPVRGKKPAGLSLKNIGEFMASLSRPSVRDPKTKIDFATQLGKPTTVVGFLENWKLGPQLAGNDFSIWIEEGGKSLPSELSNKRIIVTGTVIERNDLPVFVPEPGKPFVHQGIPVPEGTDLKKASHRFLLKDVTWKLF
jgi:hypothetical protein